jgi:hypothetical protein
MNFLLPESPPLQLNFSFLRISRMALSYTQAWQTLAVTAGVHRIFMTVRLFCSSYYDRCQGNDVKGFSNRGIRFIWLCVLCLNYYKRCYSNVIKEFSAVWMVCVTDLKKHCLLLLAEKRHSSSVCIELEEYSCHMWKVISEVGGACGTRGRGEKRVQGFGVKARRKKTALKTKA